MYYYTMTINKLISAVNFATEFFSKKTFTFINIIGENSVGKSSFIHSVNIPYINYLIELLAIVSNSGANIDVMCASVLHECLTSKMMTLEQLSEKYGYDVAKIVEFYSSNDSYPAPSDKELTCKNIWDAVNLIKTSVKLSMFSKQSTLDNSRKWNKEEFDEYFRWDMWSELNENNKIVKAITFATFAHTNPCWMKYSIDTPINHSIEVMYFLSNADITDVNILCAAVLHQTVEKCGITEQELIKFFGRTIAKIVMECTGDILLPEHIRKQEQIKNAKNLSIEAKLVKSSDVLLNISDSAVTLPMDLTEKKINGYFYWSYAVWLAIRGHNEQLDGKISQLFDMYGLLNINDKELTNHLITYYNELKSK